MKTGISPFQFFNLAIGMIIGVGWITVLGFWISSAGPGGTTIAFIVGTLLLAPVTLCYAEMAAKYPKTGGPVVYALREIGPLTGFAAGWLLCANYTLVIVFEAISIAWVIDELVPGLQGPPLYSVLGSDIHLGHLLIGIGGNVVLGIINYGGGVRAARVQDWLTWALIAAILLLGVFAFLRGDAANLAPLFETGASGLVWPGMLAVLITVPFFMSGFDAVAQGMEESGVTVTRRLISRLYLIAIAGACLFYLLIILSTSAVAPRAAFLDAGLPTAEAFRFAFGSKWAADIVLLGGLAGLLSTWNVCIFAAMRVLQALGREGMIWHRFGRPNAHGVATLSLVAVITVGSAGALLGRAAIVPLVNAASVGIGLVFFIVAVSVVALRRRRAHGEEARSMRRYAMPVFAATVSLLIAALAFWEPARSQPGLPLEWMLFGGLLVIGFVCRMLNRRPVETGDAAAI